MEGHTWRVEEHRGQLRVHGLVAGPADGEPLHAYTQATSQRQAK